MNKHRVKIVIPFFLLFFINLVFVNANEKNIELFFSHERGFYYETFTLEINCPIPTSKIKYTLDGSNPINSSTAILSNSPVFVQVNLNSIVNRDLAPGFIITVCAIDSDTLIGKIVSQTYLFPEKINSLSRDNVVPGSKWLQLGSAHDINYGMDPDIYNNANYKFQLIDAFKSIPTLSLITDLENLFDADSGIYINSLFHGDKWERSASLELLNPDGSEGFQINCGMRIRGGWSRHIDNPKHAFRFFFRKEYGKSKLEFPLFGDEGVKEFDKIDLRTSQNYSWSYYGDQNNTFLRDIFSRDAQRDMNQPYTRSKYYHLFINGTYWGLYQTQERPEANFAKSYFGGNKDDYDVIKVDIGEDFNLYNVEATDGTLDKWRELWEASEIGFADDEMYFKIQGLDKNLLPNPLFPKLLDVDNLIDYMIVTFFTGDFDGPISGFRNNNSPNNFYAIINRINPDGFKFFRHDAEHTLFFNDWGIDRTGPFTAGSDFFSSNPQWIHQKLSENKNYRLKFADRVYKHFFNNGALTLENNIKRILDRKAQIETPIVAESARWGDSKTYNPRTKIDWINAVNFIINDYLPTRNDVVLEQLKRKKLFSNLIPPQLNLQSGIISKGTEIQLSVPLGEIYYTLDGTDPYSPVNSNSNFSKEAISVSTPKKVIIPTIEHNNNWKTDINFDDSSWMMCEGENAGVGYDNANEYDKYIALNVKDFMHESGVNPNNSCFIRIPFTIENAELSSSNFMNLKIWVDDGFVAYLNGVKVAEMNAPSNIEWNSAATTYGEATDFEQFNLSQYLTLLKEGENIFAIQGLNSSIQSSDFLILPILTIGNVSNNGSVSPSAILYNNPIIINETTTIKARSLINLEWSALSENKFIITENLDNIKITELNYHPTDQIIGQDTVSGKSFEFIEIKNIGTLELNLTESSFVNGINYKFPKGAILRSKEFFVLASDSLQFINRYGFAPFGEFSGQLDNDGEKIVFINASSDTVINFVYNDKLPWPEEADGDGYSLVSTTRNPLSFPNDPNYWTKSATINGSPGVDDLVSDVIELNQNKSINFELFQNYPNPFNPTTEINFALAKSGKVNLTVYNIIGQKIAELINSNMNAGNYKTQFNAKNLASGLYFYRLETPSYSKTMKMLFIK